MSDLLTPSSFDEPHGVVERRGTCARPARELDARLAHLPGLFRATWCILSLTPAWMAANLLDAGMHAPGSLIARGLDLLDPVSRLALVWVVGLSVVLIVLDAGLLWLRCGALRGRWGRALRVCISIRAVVRELGLVAHVLIALAWACVAVVVHLSPAGPAALQRLLALNFVLGLAVAVIDAVAKNRVRGLE